jgi:hypothetical protein
MIMVVSMIVILVGGGWFFTANDLMLTRYFAPRYEQVRRETFEQSKAYRQGLEQDFAHMEYEYHTASPEEKEMIAALIRHRAAGVNLSELSPSTAQFIASLSHTTTGTTVFGAER